MSMFTRKMRMLTAVVMENDQNDVVKALLEKGVMDFVHIDSLPEDKLKSLSSHRSTVPKAVLSDLRARVEGLLRQGGVVVPELSAKDFDSSENIDIEQIKTQLDRISAVLQKNRDQQKNINQRLLSFLELEKHATGKDDGFIDLRIGSIPAEKTEDMLSRLSDISGAFVFDQLPYVTLTMKRDSSRVSEVTGKFGWIENPEPSLMKKGKERAIEALKGEISSMQKELEDLAALGKNKVAEKSDELIALWKEIRASELCEHVESYFSYTRNTTLFSGWVPESESENVENAIRKSTNGKCIIQWTEADMVDEATIPVEMKSNKIFKPFEHLVDNYGTPEYGSINPTPFTTVAYMLMFMLMFADLGQGFVLLLIGLIGSYIYKKHPEKKDGLLSRYLCSLLIYLGPSSMVGGLLFGSCFGYSVFPPLWFNYHAVVNGHASGAVQSIYSILGITIWFGVGIISTGLILNWINLFRKKRYIELICSRNGLVGGMLFALGIWFGNGFVLSGYKTFPSSPLMFPILLLGLLIIIVQTPLEYKEERKHGGVKKSIPTLIMDTFMELLVECLEIFSGFLSNTLSFMRVAGLGIAHVCLMTAFEDMADMTGNIIFKILIMVAGNVLVIGLEGLSAGIQALRLNYYEFFTKYFTGRGIAFEPVGLSGSKTV